MPENIDINKVQDVVNNPNKYLNKFEEKKENIKKEIAEKLPPDLKPYIEGNTGDIILFIFAMFILILFLKVISLAFRVILNIVGIASIIFIVYLLFKHFTGNG